MSTASALIALKHVIDAASLPTHEMASHDFARAIGIVPRYPVDQLDVLGIGALKSEWIIRGRWAQQDHRDL